MSLAQKNKKNTYTYADYLKFPKEFKSEIIDGVVYDMAPAPLRKHQDISMVLSRNISTYLKGKSCKVYAAPFDVRFGEKKDENFEIKNVVQPDLSIICDEDKLDEKGCIGSPDWIIEILSPSTSSIDMKEKYKLYEKFGVEEYWIIEPNDQIVMVFILENGKYVIGGHYDPTDYLKTKVIDGLEIDLAEVFGVEREENAPNQNEK